MSQLSRINKNLHVVRGNELVNARLDFTADQYKLILCAVAQISIDDEDFKIYWVDEKTFTSLKGSSNKGEKTRLRAMTRQLLSRPIDLPTDNGGYEQFNFISYATYDGGAGRVGIRFDPVMKPHLLQLKKNFTMVPLEVIVKFASFYTMRIYEFLKQYQTLRQRHMPLAELHLKLMTPPSYRENFSFFRRRVLEVAVGEMNELGDITFTYEAVKDGKAVAAILFFIKDNAKTSPVLTAPKVEKDGLEDVRARLTGPYRLTKAQAAFIAGKYAPLYIAQILDIVDDAVAAGKVRNIAAYTYRAFETDYRDKRANPPAPLEGDSSHPPDHNDEEASAAFDEARDEALAEVMQRVTLEELAAGFEQHMEKENAWYLDFIKLQVKRSGETFDMTKHYPRALTQFKTYAAHTYLPQKFHSLDAWLGNAPG